MTTEAEIAQIKAEVEAALNEWWEVWSVAGDFDRFMTLVADESEMLWIADAIPTFGKAAFGENFQPAQESFQRQDNTRVEWRTIVLASDVAYTVRINDCVQIDLEGNPGPTIRYAETIVWVKRDGGWKMLLGHGSTPNESVKPT